MDPPKYIKVNGITKINPEYQRWQKGKGEKSSLSHHEQSSALPVYTSTAEYLTSMNHMGMPAQMAESTQASMMIMEDQDVMKKVGISGSEYTGAMAAVFNKYEIPMGLLNKLLELQTYDFMIFLIDDSGSMASQTDTRDPRTGQWMTRWEETRTRLLELMELLAHVPTPSINIQFLNRPIDLRLYHEETASPAQFLEQMTTEINRAFQNPPSGTTPYLERIQQLFTTFSGRKVSWYFFSDGVPNGGNPAQKRIEQLCITRQNPDQNPITFFSCTSVDSEVEWMKTVEEIAPYCSEYDDYEDEKREVLKDQGFGLPFTKGFYLIGCLVGAMNPTDLDAMDESVPLTKYMLDNLLGFTHHENDYRSYFDHFIQAQVNRPVEETVDRVKKSMDWRQHYQDFLRFPTNLEIPAAQQFKAELKRMAGGMNQQGYLSPNVYGNTPQNGQQQYGQQYGSQQMYGKHGKHGSRRKSDCSLQ